MGGDFADAGLIEARRLFEEGVSRVERADVVEALPIFEGLIERFGSATDSEIRTYVEWGLLNRAFALGQLGRHADALLDYEEAIVRLGAETDDHADSQRRSMVREQRARALGGRAFALGELGRQGEAIVVYDRVLEEFGMDEEPAVRAQVANALNNKGWLLAEKGENNDALSLYDEAIWRFSHGTDSETWVAVARAYVNKGRMLETLARHRDAISTYDELIDRQLSRDDLPGLREQVAAALLSKGLLLTHASRPDEALAVFEELLGRFEQDDAAVRASVVLGEVSKGVALEALDRSAEALSMYDRTIAECRDASDAHARDALLRAYLHKAALLDEQNRIEQAITVHDELQAVFANTAEPAVRELVDSARARRDYLVARSGNI